MSYNRVTTATPKYIVFYYTKASLFDNISLRTMYRARTLLDSKGESQIDHYAMSTDETDAFLIFMKQAIYDCFDIVMKMTTGVSDPITIDGSTTIIVGGNPAAVPNTYAFKILDEEAYNENNLYTLEDGIRKFLDAHVMAAWYDMVGHADEYAKWVTKRDDYRTDLITKKLFQLKKPSLS